MIDKKSLTTISMSDFEGDLRTVIRFLKNLYAQYKDEYRIILYPDYQSGDIEVLGIAKPSNVDLDFEEV